MKEIELEMVLKHAEAGDQPVVGSYGAVPLPFLRDIGTCC
jgi:hypothetical protein